MDKKTKTTTTSKITKASAKKAVPAKKVKITLTAEERYQRVATLAYMMAEKNNFFGNQDEYWYAAERELNEGN